MDHRYEGQRDEEYMREKFNRDKMTITINWVDEDDEDVSYDLPAVFAVCPTCDGKGSHVNPSIDDQGISSHEFAEDPEFAESYFGGQYDVPCYQCQGSNVVPEIDRERITGTGSTEEKNALKEWDDAVQSEHEFRSIQDAERRMGA